MDLSRYKKLCTYCTLIAPGTMPALVLYLMPLRWMDAVPATRAGAVRRKRVCSIRGEVVGCACDSGSTRWANLSHGWDSQLGNSLASPPRRLAASDGPRPQDGKMRGCVAPTGSVAYRQASAHSSHSTAWQLQSALLYMIHKKKKLWGVNK